MSNIPTVVARPEIERGSVEELARLAERPPQMETATMLLNEQMIDLGLCLDELEARLSGVVRPSGDDLAVPSLADAGEFVRWPREILMQAERVHTAAIRIRSLLDRLEV